METVRLFRGSHEGGTNRQPPQFYSRVADEGILLPQRPVLNFTGGGVTAADDPGNNRTNVTIPLGAGLNPPANPAENNEFAYGLNGNLAYTSQMRTDGTYASFGVGVGNGPAQSGTVRLANLQVISWRNAGGTADIGNITVDAANQLSPIASATQNGFEAAIDYLNIWGETGVDVAIPIGAGYVDVETSANVFLSANNNYRYFGVAWAAWEAVANKNVFPDLMQFVVTRYNDATVRVTCLTDGSTSTGAVPLTLTGVSVITGLKWRVTIDATYHVVWGIGQDAGVARTGRATLFDFGRTNQAT